MDEEVQPRIVEATMAGSFSRRPGLAKAIEAAMSQAVLDAAEKGITDPAEVKAMMLQAREKTKQEWQGSEAPALG